VSAPPRVPSDFSAAYRAESALFIPEKAKSTRTPKRVLHVICWGNSPNGILGEAMETSASFEARSAPLPYPTTGKNSDPHGLESCAGYREVLRRIFSVLPCELPNALSERAQSCDALPGTWCVLVSFRGSWLSRIALPFELRPALDPSPPRMACRAYAPVRFRGKRRRRRRGRHSIPIAVFLRAPVPASTAALCQTGSP
jgi:hypothetical protein